MMAERIVIDGVAYVREQKFPEKIVILRCDRAGVHYGTLESRDKQEAVLTSTRRLWHWSGAASITQLAKEGTKLPRECKFTVRAARVELTDVIEVHPCTAEAIISIDAVEEWRND